MNHGSRNPPRPTTRLFDHTETPGSLVAVRDDPTLFLRSLSQLLLKSSFCPHAESVARPARSPVRVGHLPAPFFLPFEISVY
jgi:hypothetical protein